jgi:hypothetical protein
MRAKHELPQTIWSQQDQSPHGLVCCLHATDSSQQQGGSGSSQCQGGQDNQVCRLKLDGVLKHKAMLNNAGQMGHIFAGKYKPFTNANIFQMLGFYILDGLAPSPQLQQKMQPQSKEPTHGNDKIASVIGM